MSEPTSTANKLPADGRKLVRTLIIDGLFNKEIRAALVAAGYPSITDATLTHYRKDPAVVKAIAEDWEKRKQAALAERFRGRLPGPELSTTLR